MTWWKHSLHTNHRNSQCNNSTWSLNKYSKYSHDCTSIYNTRFILQEFVIGLKSQMCSHMPNNNWQKAAGGSGCIPSAPQRGSATLQPFVSRFENKPSYSFNGWKHIRSTTKQHLKILENVRNYQQTLGNRNITWYSYVIHVAPCPALIKWVLMHQQYH